MKAFDSNFIGGPSGQESVVYRAACAGSSGTQSANNTSRCKKCCIYCCDLPDTDNAVETRRDDDACSYVAIYLLDASRVRFYLLLAGTSWCFCTIAMQAWII